jgi:hypothetical protein
MCEIRDFFPLTCPVIGGFLSHIMILIHLQRLYSIEMIEETMGGD